MELREFARRILSADTLEEKLLSPQKLSDQSPGPAVFWKEPTRPKGMQFQKHTRKDKLPPLHTLSSKDNRAICLHRFAGHELLAVEIMAYALLAFPNAPKYFRRGLANTLKEEQEHVRLYIKRLKDLGVYFGDLPLYKHFWAYTPYLTNPKEYVSVMSLTFEMANLDYAPMYGKVFLEHGDYASMQLMQKILHDEIAHVSFGWNWLKKLKDPTVSEWKAWRESLPDMLPIERSRGPIIYKENRKKAGIPSSFWADLSNPFVNDMGGI